MSFSNQIPLSNGSDVVLLGTKHCILMGQELVVYKTRHCLLEAMKSTANYELLVQLPFPYIYSRDVTTTCSGKLHAADIC
jgi:hypothetical protein